jgi:hypothetical protein
MANTLPAMASDAQDAPNELGRPAFGCGGVTEKRHRMVALRCLQREISGEPASPDPVVFASNPWYYLHAFVALVSLLTRLTRLPGHHPTAVFFERARPAGAQIAF